jgi:hypothetical protein
LESRLFCSVTGFTSESAKAGGCTIKIFTSGLIYPKENLRDEAKATCVAAIDKLARAHPPARLSGDRKIIAAHVQAGCDAYGSNHRAQEALRKIASERQELGLPGPIPRGNLLLVENAF